MIYYIQTMNQFTQIDYKILELVYKEAAAMELELANNRYIAEFMLPDMDSTFRIFASHRITSYNVCYTKLLRLNSAGPSGAHVPKTYALLLRP